jgi:hypothetical protein
MRVERAHFEKVPKRHFRRDATVHILPALEGGHFFMERSGDTEADAQSGRDRFRHAAHVTDGAAVIEREHRRERAFIDQLAVNIIFDQSHAMRPADLHEPFTIPHGHGGAARIGQGRADKKDPRLPPAKQFVRLLRIDPIGIADGDREDAAACGADQLEQGIVGGHLTGDDITGPGHRGEHQLQSLLAASDGEHLFSANRCAPLLGQPGGQQFAQRPVTFRPMVGAHRLAFFRKGARKGGRQVGHGQSLGGGDACSEIDQAGLAGLTHEINQPALGGEGKWRGHWQFSSEFG